MNIKKSFDTVKNINELSGLFLPRGVFLIIQYAKDETIKDLLIYLIHLVQEIVVADCFFLDCSISWKENLLRLLMFDFYTDDISDTDEFQAKNYLRQYIITHINCIAACYESYYFPQDFSNGTEDASVIKEVHKICNVDISPIFRAKPLSSAQKSDIIQMIIDNFMKNGFYYAISMGDGKEYNYQLDDYCENKQEEKEPIEGDADVVVETQEKEQLQEQARQQEIAKQIVLDEAYENLVNTSEQKRIYKYEVIFDKKADEFDKVKTKRTVYNLVNKERDPYIIDDCTGLKLNIGKRITSFAKIDKNGTIKFFNNSYNTFKTSHERIIKIVTFKPTQCHWCAPNKETRNEKVKCTNCHKLLYELDNLMKTNSIEKVDFNKRISSIDFTKANNIADLRKKRKNAVVSYLKQYESQITDKKKIEQIKELAEKSFSTSEELKN